MAVRQRNLRPPAQALEDLACCVAAPPPGRREPWTASLVVAAAGIGVALRPELRGPILLLLIATLLSPPGIRALTKVHASFMGGTLEDTRVETALRDIMKGGMGDAITDDLVKKALNDNIKGAVADALRDPEFTQIALETIKDALRDRAVHRAALEGAMGNLSVKLNPFRRSEPEEASPRARSDSDVKDVPPA